MTPATEAVIVNYIGELRLSQRVIMMASLLRMILGALLVLAPLGYFLSKTIGVAGAIAVCWALWFLDRIWVVLLEIEDKLGKNSN